MSEPALTLVPDNEGPDMADVQHANTPAIWEDFQTRVNRLKTTAETLVVTNASQVEEMKLARTTRLTLKAIRVEIDKKRTELGEEALRRKQRIDQAARQLRDIIEPLEERLLLQEQFVERETARAEQERRGARIVEVTPFLSAPVAVDLGKLADSRSCAANNDRGTAV